MSVKREVEALDEALLYLNEGKNKAQQDRVQIKEKIVRAIKYFIQIQGKTLFIANTGGIRFLGGAVANRDFVNGKSKSFVIILSPGTDNSTGTSIDGTTVGNSWSTTTNSSELGDIIKLINTKRREVEDTVFERTGIKVSIKIGDPHAVTSKPTVVVTLR